MHDRAQTFSLLAILLALRSMRLTLAHSDCTAPLTQIPARLFFPRGRIFFISAVSLVGLGRLCQHRFSRFLLEIFRTALISFRLRLIPHGQTTFPRCFRN